MWSTHSLNTWSRVLLEKLIVPELVKKFSIFCGTQRLITMFTRVCHLSLSLVREIQCTSPAPIIFPQPGSNITIPAIPGSFQVDSVPEISPPKPCLHLHVSLTCYMHCPYNFSWFDHANNTCPQYRSCSSSCTVLHPPATLFLLGPNILLSTLFVNTPSLYSSVSVRNQASYPYKTEEKIMALYFNVHIFR